MRIDIRRFRVVLTTLAIALCLPAAACELPLGPAEGASESPPPPDVSGTWRLADSRVPSVPVRTEGYCTIEGLTFELTAAGHGTGMLRDGFEYEGTHSPFTMRCHGDDRPATEVFDVQDSVMIVDGGFASATVEYTPACRILSCSSSEAGWDAAISLPGPAISFDAGNLSSGSVGYLRGTINWWGPDWTVRARVGNARANRT